MAEEVLNGLRESILQEVRETVSDGSEEERFAFNELMDGLGDALENQKQIKADPDAEIEDIEAADEIVHEMLDEYLGLLAQNNTAKYGEYLFNNPAGAGAYACARCHTAGYSWNAGEELKENPNLTGLIKPEIPGSGGFGPSLIGVVSQFSSASAQEAFISTGCEPNLSYGLNGVCEPSGQMPGFGVNATELEGAMLSPEQIAAIVEYERGLE